MLSSTISWTTKSQRMRDIQVFRWGSKSRRRRSYSQNLVLDWLLTKISFPQSNLHMILILWIGLGKTRNPGAEKNTMIKKAWGLRNDRIQLTMQTTIQGWIQINRRQARFRTGRIWCMVVITKIGHLSAKTLSDINEVHSNVLCIYYLLYNITLFKQMSYEDTK